MEQINDVNKNNNIIEKNYKEDKNKNEQIIKKLKGEIKEYLNIIEEQNKRIDLMQKDFDRIKQDLYLSENEMNTMVSQSEEENEKLVSMFSNFVENSRTSYSK